MIERKRGEMVRTFAVAFALKFVLDFAAGWGENCRLSLEALEASSAAVVCVIGGVYLSRRIIRDGDDVVVLACIVAAFLATWSSVVDLQNRAEDERVLRVGE